MFYYEINREIRNSLIRMSITVLIDVLLIITAFLVYKPLVILPGIYAAFTISIIRPLIIYIADLKNMKMIYKSDKHKVYGMLNDKIIDLEKVVKGQSAFQDRGDLHEHYSTGNNYRVQRKRSRTSRSYASILRGRYNLFIRLRDNVTKDIQKEMQNKNEF